MFLRTPYNYDADVVSHQTGLSCPEPSRAQQHFRDECDINNLVKRFAKTGIPPQPEFDPYVEHEGVFDFQSAMNQIVAAERAFASLPSKVRREFDNNPAELLQFLDNPSNRDEAARLGLITPKADPTPDPTPPAPPAPPTTVPDGA